MSRLFLFRDFNKTSNYHGYLLEIKHGSGQSPKNMGGFIGIHHRFLWSIASSACQVWFFSIVDLPMINGKPPYFPLVFPMGFEQITGISIYFNGFQPFNSVIWPYLTPVVASVTGSRFRLRGAGALCGSSEERFPHRPWVFDDGMRPREMARWPSGQ